MNEPRPAMISARPLEMRSTVANSSNTRTGIVGGKDRDGAGQADVLGARRRRGEYHSRRGGDEILPVVLADAEDVETDLIGQLDLLHQVSEPLDGVDPLAGQRIRGIFDKRIDPEFHAIAPVKMRRPR